MYEFFIIAQSKSMNRNEFASQLLNWCWLKKKNVDDQDTKRGREREREEKKRQYIFSIFNVWIIWIQWIFMYACIGIFAYAQLLLNMKKDDMIKLTFIEWLIWNW